MIKLYHGHTNFLNLFRFIAKAEQNKRATSFEKMGNVVTITPHGNGVYELVLGNDDIIFEADFMKTVVIPLRVINIIEDLDQTTFVTGTKIVKPQAMPKADERLYKICKMHDWLFEFGREII